MSATNDACLGLDVGTSSVCAVALDGEGNLLVSAARPNDAALAGLPAGHYEQSPSRILELSLAVLRELTDSLGSAASGVGALGLTGQMHGVLLAGDRLGPLTNLVTWQDRRAEEPASDGQRTFLEQLARRVDNSALGETGSRPATGYMAATLYWLLQGPGFPRGARWALVVHDWVAAKLAGGEPLTDPTDAASTGLYNVRLNRWDERITGPLGIDARLLPRVEEAGTSLGRVSAEVAAATGLPPQTTVHTALGDNQAGVLASLREPEKELLVNIGTGGQVSAVTRDFFTTPDLDARPFPGGRLLSVGASLCGGSAFGYLAEHYARAVRALTGPEVAVSDILESLVSLASSTPAGADGLAVEPLFAGKRSEPSRRGSIAGMSLENNTPGQWARAFMEGIVAELAGYYEQMLCAGLRPRARLVGSGNGMRLNAVMRDAAARAFDMPVAVPKWQEEAACGAALAAMVGAGSLRSFEEASALVRYEGDV